MGVKSPTKGMPWNGTPTELLERLSNAFGPSGFERDPAALIADFGRGLRYDTSSDNLGSVVITVKGRSEAPKILLGAHIDEVGFVVTGIDSETGFLTFAPLGGWFDQVLLGHRVTIRTLRGDITGVFASKPPHLLSSEERDKVIKMDSMFIDVGTHNKVTTEDELGIRVGDPVVPSSVFETIRKGRIAVGKAFDDRVGVLVGLEVLRGLKEKQLRLPGTISFAATVQEEVGLRGAQTVANLVKPDVAIALEVDIAGDVPGIRSREAPTKLGQGPAILTYDASMIPNQEFKRFVIEAAEKENIPHQLSVSLHGGTDAGKFQVNRGGCPSIVIGVPARHIHSYSSMIDFSDVEATVNLVLALIKQLDSTTVRRFVER